MPNEVLLYTGINSSSAERFVTSFNEFEDVDVDIRINTNGGEPEQLWGMVTKVLEHKGVVNTKVDGKAYSGGIFFLCYSKFRQSTDVAQFLLHRASFGLWFEQSEWMTESHWEILNRINKNLRTACEHTIDEKVFEKITGKTLDDVFSNDTRIDVTFGAREAKRIGFIDKIVKITPEVQTSMANATMKIAAEFGAETINVGVEEISTAPENSNKDFNKNKNLNMTLPEIQSKHPELYAQIVAVGVQKEKIRVKSFMSFFDIDAKSVKEKIESEEEFDISFSAEMSRKAIAKATGDNMEADNVKTPETEKIPDGEKPDEKDVADMTVAVKEKLGLNAENK